jgi:hypothetical protein
MKARLASACSGGHGRNFSTTHVVGLNFTLVHRLVGDTPVNHPHARAGMRGKDFVSLDAFFCKSYTKKPRMSVTMHDVNSLGLNPRFSVAVCVRMDLTN